MTRIRENPKSKAWARLRSLTKLSCRGVVTEAIHVSLVLARGEGRLLIAGFADQAEPSRSFFPFAQLTYSLLHVSCSLQQTRLHASPKTQPVRGLSHHLPHLPFGLLHLVRISGLRFWRNPVPPAPAFSPKLRSTKHSHIAKAVTELYLATCDSRNNGCVVRVSPIHSLLMQRCFAV